MSSDSKVAPRRLKGFQDYSPDLMSKRLRVMQAARKVAQHSGFCEIATPALEYAEVLLGVGGETDKQVFRFMDGGERDVAMRYDLTVPFARYAAENYGALPLPFKRLQIGDVWRAEKPQKGRFREFCQCDFDIIGADSMSADLEIMQAILSTLNRVVGMPFTIACNNRKVLSQLIRKILGFTTKADEEQALILLDKLDKQGTESIVALFCEKFSLNEDRIRKLLSLMTSFRQDNPETLLEYFDTEESKVEWNRFLQTVHILQELAGDGFGKVVIDLSIARGLAYYTGLVYETTVDGVKGFGSISSGGRYDDLAARFCKHVMPGVGGSIGVDRLCALLSEKDSGQKIATTQVFVAIASQNEFAHAFGVISRLRTEGISVDYSLKEQKLGAQFKSANKLGCPWVVVIGSDEVATQNYTLKNMETGVEKKLQFDELIAILRAPIL